MKYNGRKVLTPILKAMTDLRRLIERTFLFLKLFLSLPQFKASLVFFSIELLPLTNINMMTEARRAGSESKASVGRQPIKVNRNAVIMGVKLKASDGID